MKAPWHLWLIGIVSLLWNAVGAYDYVMTNTRNAAYLSNFTEDQLAYFTEFPTWVTVFWSLGIGGALLGSILLLMRSRMAIWSFLVSLVGMLVTSFFGLVLSPISLVDVMGVGAATFSLAILLVGLFLFAYARRMKMRGVLS